MPHKLWQASGSEPGKEKDPDNKLIKAVDEEQSVTIMLINLVTIMLINLVV